MPLLFCLPVSRERRPFFFYGGIIYYLIMWRTPYTCEVKGCKYLCKKIRDVTIGRRKCKEPESEARHNRWKILSRKPEQVNSTSRIAHKQEKFREQGKFINQKTSVSRKFPRTGGLTHRENSASRKSSQTESLRQQEDSTSRSLTHRESTAHRESLQTG